MGKRQLLISYPAAKKSQQGRLQKLQTLLQAVGNEVVKAAWGEDPGAPTSTELWSIERLHGLCLSAALYESTVVVEWSDSSRSPMFVGDLLDSLEQRDMLARLLLACWFGLSLRRHIEAVIAAEGETVSDLHLSLVLSALASVSKGMRGRLGGNPRPTENRAVGLLTVDALSVVEEAWKRAVHDRVPAHCHVWSSNGRHRTPIPGWKDLPNPTPSRLVYRFRTLVSLLMLLDWDQLTKPYPSEQEGAETMAPLPKAFTAVAVSAVDVNLLPMADGNDWMEEDWAHVNWECVSEFRDEGIADGLWGCVIAERCACLYRIADCVCRFTERFEMLILWEKCGWAAWVPSSAVAIDVPVTMTYRRRHHRIKYVTQHSSKRCQELANISFVQSLVSTKVIELCIKEASKYHSL
jgi:hypothetical protein